MAASRVTTVGVEVLADGGAAAKARVSSLAAQVLADGGAAKARVSSLGVEVLRTVSTRVAGKQPIVIICT